MKLFQAIEQANQKGKMGLILYTIPNFPNPSQYQEIHDYLLNQSFVSIVETTFPVKESFSDHANATIVSAHQMASQHGNDVDGILDQYPFSKASLCVLYRQSVDSIGFEKLMKKMSGRVDGIVLEWSEPEENKYSQYAYYEQIASAYDVELVQCIGPWMKKAEVQATLKYVKKNGLVYLMSAEKTGADLFDSSVLAEIIRLTKSIRHDIKIAAGFGIGNATQIRKLAEVEGLDAVIIGTAFLKVMADSKESMIPYLTEIQESLSCERITN
jgi:tryptophan synthase alpha subunit